VHFKIPDIRDRADEALDIIKKAPIHLDDLSHKLGTSKIQAAYIVQELQKRGTSVCFRGDTIFYPQNTLGAYFMGALCLMGVPVMSVMLWG
jgi:DNA-binding IclR family transcriptional regulator